MEENARPENADDGAKMVNKPSAVPTAMSHLSEEVTQLYAALEKLGMRLEPVLGPSDADKLGEPENSQSNKLSDAINYQANQVSGANRLIRNLTKRLEV